VIISAEGLNRARASDTVMFGSAGSGGSCFVHVVAKMPRGLNPVRRERVGWSPCSSESSEVALASSCPVKISVVHKMHGDGHKVGRGRYI